MDLDLEKIRRETGIPMRILQRAKESSTLPPYPAQTLSEAEDAYLSAPDEGREYGDQTLLRVTRRIIELRSN